MQLSWIVLCVELMIIVKLIYSQCIDGECENHCQGHLSSSCTACLKGWSGSTHNSCQRENVALNKNATLSSTAKDTSGVNLARYAVDGDTYTEAKTMAENNPTLIIHLDEMTTIKYMEIHLLLEESSSYNVFVVNASGRECTQNTLCSNITNPPTMYHVWKITCTGDRSLTGNQVIIERQTELGTLSIFEVFIFHCSKGTYRYLCDRMCSHCFDSSCDGYLGVCKKGCVDGWSGLSCHCNPRCKDGCGVDGECLTGCASGWYGNYCAELCLQEGCQECDQMTGNCTQCNSDSGSFGKPIIYIITLGVLLLGLFLIATGILIQKKRRQKAAPENTYESTISTPHGNAEYDKIQLDPVYHNIDCHVQS